MKIKEFLLKEDEIIDLIDYLKSILENQDKIILLKGDLASGKTTLVRNFVKSLDIEDYVNSPTFSLQVVYSDNIFHYDLYNKTLQDFIALGMLEEFEKDGLHFIEWADESLENILSDYGFSFLKIEIEKKDNKRLYKIYE
ncbi:tRNA (adenosine(37)-N6)-threonylcarbamoyltransferase complex ATPase subunit type 1 TsaE [Arcobacter porcinus]|uniref:tRNA threonylcarbamoyladenosine biosynthesis protein TsaE n=1 Tax=Arcobacter porcinus TaxID=1935204 RepID=A0A5C2HC17_9BACT|nr:tRNA threonylcarbamoyladenosine biosynthesis protein TsaE [Aliarcobacter thereius]QEP40423.1 N6-L-threonylcarbamoyladenine synthase, TsaE subunit [Arcobacter porcinus]